MYLVAYILKEEMKARPPTLWDIHVRFAIRLPDEEIQLPVGTWLLELSTDTGSSSNRRNKLLSNITQPSRRCPFYTNIDRCIPVSILNQSTTFTLKNTLRQIQCLMMLTAEQRLVVGCQRLKGRLYMRCLLR
jgi:hypothetical protein